MKVIFLVVVVIIILAVLLAVCTAGNDLDMINITKERPGNSSSTPDKISIWNGWKKMFNDELPSFKDIGQLWEEWKKKHGKSYKYWDEEDGRRHIFYENFMEAWTHNKEYDLGKVSGLRVLDEFADGSIPRQGVLAAMDYL